jgi:uncharacterized membrane protein
MRTVSMMPLAVGTGVVVIVVAAAVVAVVLIVALSMRGRQTRGAQWRGEARRDLDHANERAEEAERDREGAQSRVAAPSDEAES